MNIDKFCLRCNKKFNVSKNDIQKYCSVECARKSRTRKTYQCKSCGKNTNNKVYCSRHCRTKQSAIVICKHCNQQFQQTRIRQKYCNLICANRHNRINYTKSYTRSKDEILLYNLLKNKYSHLLIVNNDRNTFDGLEIDIWIPELKLAIEWNGPFHYKPIKGMENLMKQQKRDAEKLILANKLDIHLLVIMATKNKNQFNQVYDDICKIIDKLLKIADEQSCGQLDILTDNR